MHTKHRLTFLMDSVVGLDCRDQDDNDLLASPKVQVRSSSLIRKASVEHKLVYDNQADDVWEKRLTSSTPF